jgi:hypothetical protein
MKSEATSRVHKLTVGIPETLYALGEEERARLGESRSQYVANLYRAHFKNVRRQEKIARYSVAHASMPPTSGEDMLTCMSESTLFSDLVHQRYSGAYLQIL